MQKITLFFLILPLFAMTQSDTTFNDSGNILSINEKGIDNLISKYEKILKSKNGVDGWRVQIKFKAKESEILELKIRFIQLYPEIPITLEYAEPYYRIRVGNCRTKIEAIKIKNHIRKHFPNAYPVPEIINFSKLEE